MKPLTLLLMALFLGPSVGASPSGEEFLVENIREIRDAITIQDVRTVAPVRPLPAPSPRPMATDSAIPSKLIEREPQAGMGRGSTAAQLPMVSDSERAR